LQIADGALPHVPVDKDAPIGEFDKIAPEHPVFRIQASPHGKKSSGNEGSYLPVNALFKR
jgi:hypothetical protein